MMRRIASLLLIAALGLGAGSAYALEHSSSLYSAAQGEAQLSQQAAQRFSIEGVPTDLDSQLAGLDHRRALMGEAGWWREAGFFLLIWVVVLGGAAYLASSIREDLEDEAPAPPPAG